jgi:hypothetical protein
MRSTELVREHQGSERMTEYRRSLHLAAAALGATAVAFSFTSAVGQAASGPHIAANPRSVMVTKTTMLTGKGFPANSLIHLQECGATAWIIPQNECDTSNEVTVMTDHKGRFTTPFQVQLCPRELPPKPPVTRETCFIGEPQVTGEDTAGLLGAVKITVTYP